MSHGESSLFQGFHNECNVTGQQIANISFFGKKLFDIGHYNQVL
jgi:hypothetical protein